MKSETLFIVQDRDLVLIHRMVMISRDIMIIRLMAKPNSVEKNNV